MADTKVTGLSENTDPQQTDVLYIVDDPGGSPASEKVTIANIKAAVNDVSTDTLWNAAGDILYATGSDAGTVLAVGGAGQFLTTDGTTPSWGDATTTSMVDDPLWNAAGDLAYGTGSDAGTVLSAGSAGYALRMNSGATAPEWVAGGRVLIDEQTATGSEGTITFSSIPATYNALRLEWVARSGKTGANDHGIDVKFNNDTTAGNYRMQRINAYNTTIVGSEGDDFNIIFLPAADAPANSAGYGYANIIEYAGTTWKKQALSFSFYRFTAGSSLEEVNMKTAMEWESTAAINEIDIVSDSGYFVSGSIFRLYGMY